MNTRTCCICGVTNETKNIKLFHNQMLCAKHVTQMRKYGRIIDPTPRTTKDKNEFIIHDTYAEIVLRNKREEITGLTQIDLCDVERCRNIKWHYNQNGYITGTTKEKKHVRLHKFILNYDGNMDIDHIDMDKLNNRRENLRIVDRCINSSNNKSPGVYLNQNKTKWIGKFTRYGKTYTVGTFDKYEDAAAAVQNKKNELDQNCEAILRERNEKKQTCSTGIWFNNNKWIANIYMNGKNHRVGTYKTKTEAMVARMNAILKYKRVAG